MFDSLLPFSPKNLELTTLTSDSKNALEDIYINQKNQFLKQENRPCDDPLIIKVPDGEYPLQVYFIKKEN